MNILYIWIALLGVGTNVTEERTSDRYNWSRVVDVSSVNININEVGERELAQMISKRTGQQQDYRNARSRSNRGLAILYRNKETNEYRCEVYVLDLNDKVTLEHETRHCYGWVHQ